MNLPDTENFNFKDCVIGGDDCVLITPNDIRCTWTEDNLKFRSMIVRKSDHKVISRGFNKFFNWSEKPDLNKFPNGGFTAIEKMDGSLLIWGCHNEEIIHRTRGTVNAEQMVNGKEIEFLKKKYSKFVNNLFLFSDYYSILTEWTTPSNVIVINNAKEPTLSLIGIINNETGELTSQSYLDVLADTWYMNRPKRYEFDSIHDCIEDVKMWEGKEGVVLYSECGQYLRKCKADWYLSLHALATGVKGVKQVLGVFMESHRPTTYDEFYKYVEDTMDHEIAEKCKDYMQDVVNAFNDFRKDVEDIEYELDTYIKKLDTRKDQAIAIQTRFRTGIEKSMAFTMLDKAFIDDKLVQKYMENKLNI
jgi:T4 RnlA family RNA ligase